MTTKDIEKLVNKKLKIERINKKIKKRYDNYLLIMNNLEDGYDLTNGTTISNKQTIERRKREEIDKYFNYYQKMQSKIVDIEANVEEKEIKEEKRKRIIKKRKLKNIGKVALGLSLIATIGTCTVGLTTYCNHNNEVERKTKIANNELKSVIDKNTFTKINNLVFQGGKIVEKVDEKYASPDQIQWVETIPISKCIENSNNPDLYFYTLYKDFGRVNDPKFYKICRKTFKYLEFEGSEYASSDNLDKYIELNGYNDLNDYYNACRKELFSDDNNELNNIKVKIKKMTK